MCKETEEFMQKVASMEVKEYTETELELIEKLAKIIKKHELISYSELLDFFIELKHEHREDKKVYAFLRKVISFIVREHSFFDDYIVSMPWYDIEE